ncbi:MAG: DUF1287 domain-containing protein [Fimbriimonadaceae bacterium]|nr:DUF1287 domain-containing protein [Fimbriimonadaceae bacterium]
MWTAAIVVLSLTLAPPQAKPTESPATKIVAGARQQLNWGTTYNGAYVRINYPNGDVPKTQGVCTDVVVRAFRHAGYDLQQLIHEDMKTAWSSYPRYPGNSKPDPNIDHRRCPNQIAFFKRHGKKLTTSVEAANKSEWKPGDVVFWKLSSGLDHVGVLTDKRNEKGLPLVIHNLNKPTEEDVLESYKIVAHFRYPR